MNITQIRKATFLKLEEARTRNTALYLKEITEGLTREEEDEMEQLDERITNLKAIQDEFCTKKAPKLDANLRALVAANID